MFITVTLEIFQNVNTIDAYMICNSCAQTQAQLGTTTENRTKSHSVGYLLIYLLLQYSSCRNSVLVKVCVHGIVHIVLKM